LKSYDSGRGTEDRQRNADRAVENFTQALQLSANPVPLNYINRSNAYLLAGDYERAIGDLGEALRLDPLDRFAAMVNRCAVLAKAGRMEAALADCNAFLKGKRGNLFTAYALGTRGLVYLLMNKADLALTDYDAALRLVDATDSHQRPRCLVGRGIARLLNGDRIGGNADISSGKAVNPSVVREFEDEGLL
jgi:tetratricopeptide (TPR) repeat protein